MVTELFCNASGGPEMVTSKGFDDAKLGIDPNQWDAFLHVAAEAAMLWPTKHHRDMVLKLCELCKAEICFGLEGQGTELPHDSLNGGDIYAAKPTQAFEMAKTCPFSGKSGGQCPFSGPSPVNATLVADTPVPVSVVQPVPAATNGQIPMAGRVLDNSLQRSLDALLEEDPDLCCPVSLMVFSDPVRASDGFIYESAMLQQLLKNKQRSPMTREVLKSGYQQATGKLAEAIEFRHNRSSDLVKFASQAAAEQPQMASTALERASDYLAVLQTEQARSVAAEVRNLYMKLGRPIPNTLQRMCYSVIMV
jgi:hypothetical protein